MKADAMKSFSAREIFDFLKQTVSEFSEDCCMRMGAALAYYTVFAMPPVAVLLILILGLTYRATGQGDKAEAREDLQNQVKMFVGEQASEEITTIIKKADLGSGWLQWTLGIAGVVVSATGVVIALQGTLNEAWEVQPDPNQGGILNFLLKRVFSLGMILGLGFILLVSTLLTSWLSNYLGGGSAVTAAVISFIIILGLFTAIFKYLPDATIVWKDALIGAAVTTVLFVIGKAALDIYLARSNMESQFGAAAAFAILMAWVYYTSLILLYGAEFTQAWAKRFGGGVTPEPGAVRVTRKFERVDEPADPQPA